MSQITVVVPVYNRAGLVGRTLDSIAAQTLRPLSVILVDNNSVDGSLDILNRWKAEHEADDFEITVLTEQKPGACAARNKGLEAVTTPYIMFFDSDDTMIPTHVESALCALQEDKTLDIVGWNVRIHLHNSCSQSVDNEFVVKPFCQEDVLFNHVFHSTFSTLRYAVKTDLVRQVGGWNEEVAGWNDYELGVRIILAQPRLKKLVNGVGVDVYFQTESITGTGFSTTPRKWESSLDCCEQSLRNAGEFKAVKWIEMRRAILAGMYLKEGNKTESRRLLSKLMDRTTSKFERLLYKTVCRYISLGGRGVAYLAKMFL